MIELNLLPDIKQQFIKTQRTRRLVISVSAIVTATALLILIILFGVNLTQKKHLNDLTRDINSESAALEQKPDIGKILTVQNQLESLTNLHAGEPAASRLFDSYLNELTPASVTISSLQVGFQTGTITIAGDANSLSTVNQYVDTLKFTKYTTSTNSQPAGAFTNVVLSSFGINSGSSGNQAASYNITMSFSPNIFNITQKVTLSVPNLITTRSDLAQPTDLFANPPASQEGQ